MYENGEKEGEKVSPPVELTEPSQLWLILTVRNTECSKHRRHLLAWLCFRNKKTVFEKYSASRTQSIGKKIIKNLQHIQVVAKSFSKPQDDFIQGKTIISAAMVKKKKKGNRRQEKQRMTLMPRRYNVTHFIEIISFH